MKRLYIGKHSVTGTWDVWWHIETSDGARDEAPMKTFATKRAAMAYVDSVLDDAGARSEATIKKEST